MVSRLKEKVEEAVEEAVEEEDTSQQEGYRNLRDAGTTTTNDRYGELLHRSRKS